MAKKTVDVEQNIVIIGGGTGLSVVLRGLKNITPNITAIVTMADDGGGSGKLREDLGMLPPGDIRSCILSLANTEPIMEKLLQYRFGEGELKGQSFGNLFLAAMNGICGNFENAVKEMANVLAVTGQVLPMTIETVDLSAKLKNGMIVNGESKIPHGAMVFDSEIEEIFLQPTQVKPLSESLDAIKNADIVILGPGSLYTSVIPNLLVEGIKEAIIDSKAKCIYLPNVMTQPGETTGYDVVDHIKAIERHTGLELIDEIIVNSELIPDDVLEQYILEGANQVLLDEKQKQSLKQCNIEIIEAEFIEVNKGYIRHDALKLSEIIKKRI
ncbi:MAG: YvcK family protein [Tissierellales bacterium]|jgi:uncharacterized cofD-like protein|nr:YvcK family protein [Tissierellales bacterium]